MLASAVEAEVSVVDAVVVGAVPMISISSVIRVASRWAWAARYVAMASERKKSVSSQQ